MTTTIILVIFGWVSYGIIILASLLNIFEFVRKKFGNKKVPLQGKKED